MTVESACASHCVEENAMRSEIRRLQSELETARHNKDCAVLSLQLLPRVCMYDGVHFTLG